MLPFLDIVKTGLEDIVAETFWFLLKSIKGHIWFVKTFAQGIWERLLELFRFVYLSPDRYEIKAKGCDDWKTICGIFHKSIMHAIIILVHIYFFKLDFFFAVYCSAADFLQYFLRLHIAIRFQIYITWRWLLNWCRDFFKNFDIFEIVNLSTIICNEICRHYCISATCIYWRYRYESQKLNKITKQHLKRQGTFM